MDHLQIRETALEHLIKHPVIRVREFAAAQNVQISSVIGALDHDIRFVRTPGDGCWDWRAYLKHGKPKPFKNSHR